MGAAIGGRRRVFWPLGSIPLGEAIQSRCWPREKLREVDLGPFVGEPAIPIGGRSVSCEPEFSGQVFEGGWLGSGEFWVWL